MQRKKDIIIGILGIFIYFACSSFIVPILSIFNIDPSTWSTTQVFAFNIIYELITLIIIALLLKDTLKVHFSEFYQYGKKLIAKFIPYWFTMLGLTIFVNLILNYLTQDIAQNQQQVQQLFDINPIATMILACLIAPFLEEFVFRLCVQKIFGKSKYLFIVCSGLLFGLLHVIGSATTFYEWLYIIPYSIPGFIFAYTLYKSHNIFVPVSLHMIHNSFTFLLQIVTTLL